jgi:hypothetical protein
MIRRGLNGRFICKCRCDEKLKAEAEGSRRLAYTGFLGSLEVDVCLFCLFITGGRLHWVPRESGSGRLPALSVYYR